MAKEKSDPNKWIDEFEDWWEGGNNLKNDYRITFRYVADIEMWFMWNGRHYELTVELEITKAIRVYFREIELPYSADGVGVFLKITKENYYSLIKDWNLANIKSIENGYMFVDSELSYRFMPNCLVEVSLPWNIFPLCTYSYPVEWHENPHETPLCDEVRRLNPEALFVLERFMMCIFVGDMSNELGLFLAGQLSSGKSTALDILDAIYGPDFIAYDDILNLNSSNFGKAHLIGKGLLLCKEAIIGTWGKKSIADYKAVTGRDGHITIEAKNHNKKSVKLTPFFFIHAANQLSDFPDATDCNAVLKRMYIREWNNPPLVEDDTFKERLKLEASDIFSELWRMCFEYPQSRKNMKWHYEDGVLKKSSRDWAAYMEPIYEKWKSAVSIAVKALFVFEEYSYILYEEVFDLVKDYIITKKLPQVSDHKIKGDITTTLSKMGCPKRGQREATKYINLRLKNVCDVSESDISDRPAATSNWRLDIQNVLRTGGKTLSQLESELTISLMDIKGELKGMEAERLVTKLGGVYMMEGC